MAGSSSKFPAVGTFCGEDYPDWSKKMKKHLKSKGLWIWVKEGCKKPKLTEGLSGKEMEEMKNEMVNDAKALSLIHQSLSPNIFMRVFDAKTAKEAWDSLETMVKAKSKKNESLQLLEDNRPSADLMNDPPQEPEDESSSEFPKSSDESEAGQDDGGAPLSGSKPFFDILLMKSAVKPMCHMNFPTRVDSMLPSTNILAKVRFFRKIYKIYFYGTRKQKSFGSGWRQLVDEHNLLEGDFLVFEIVESNDSKLKINLQVLRSTLPPELEEEIKRRKSAKPKVIIDLDEDDD